MAERSRRILKQEPIEVDMRGRSAEDIVAEVLDKANERGKCGDVATRLVRAKLRLCLNVHILDHSADNADRKPRAGPGYAPYDFEIEDTVIKIAVGSPSEKNLRQIGEILDSKCREVWLLSRGDRVDSWRTELKKALQRDSRRVMVTSLELFVGNDISELARLSIRGKNKYLEDLFAICNEESTASGGAVGVRIAAE